MLSTVAAWKLGAVPVPVRWDLPDWELERLREAIDAAVHLGERQTSTWIATPPPTADGAATSPT